MFERFARAARAAVEEAKNEAGRRGDRSIASEHLLLAVLQDDELAQLAGVDASRAREAAERLDRAALEAIGLTVDEFGGTASAGARWSPSTAASRLTPGAKAVIQGSLMHAADEKARAITTRHLMLALLDRPMPDPVASLLAELHLDTARLRERLAAVRHSDS